MTAEESKRDRARGKLNRPVRVFGEADIVAIRELCARRDVLTAELATLTHRALADKFDTTPSNIWNISNYKTYKWVR